MNGVCDADTISVKLRLVSIKTAIKMIVAHKFFKRISHYLSLCQNRMACNREHVINSLFEVPIIEKSHMVS